MMVFVRTRSTVHVNQLDKKKVLNMVVGRLLKACGQTVHDVRSSQG